MRDVGIPLGLIIVTAALGSACRGDGEARRTETDAIPMVATVTATDFEFDAPDTLPEGWTTFHLVNNGSAIHAALLVKLEEGRTLDGFLEGYSQAQEAGGPWDALGLLGGIVAPPPQGSTNATMYLGAGHYAWYCPLRSADGVSYVTGHRMARPFVVTQRGASAPQSVAPKSSVTITMIDYAFLLNAPLTAGQHMIRVENQGPEPHEVILMKLAPGKSVGDVQTWLEDFWSPHPFSSASGGVVIENAGAESFFEVDLTPGNYVLFCDISAPDGRPHWQHGMIMPVQVN